MCRQIGVLAIQTVFRGKAAKQAEIISLVALNLNGVFFFPVQAASAAVKCRSKAGGKEYHEFVISLNKRMPLRHLCRVIWVTLIWFGYYL